VPLSIVVLQTLKSGARADAILDHLQAHLAPAQRHTFRDSAVARLPCNLLPEEAAPTSSSASTGSTATAATASRAAHRERRCPAVSRARVRLSSATPSAK
jgi:hypothetical protein